MSAYDDLRDVETALDSAVSGWIGFRWKATTKVGQRCFRLVSMLRERHYRAWGLNCSLRARLSRALADNNGLRDGNAQMTAQIERLENALRLSRHFLLRYQPDLETGRRVLEEIDERLYERNRLGDFDPPRRAS